jgi:hypothetical protein
MKPYFLKLKFEKPDVRSTDGNSWIMAGRYTKDADGEPLLTPHCGTLVEIEWHIDRMRAELEEIRKEARKKYAVAKAAPLEIEL